MSKKYFLICSAFLFGLNISSNTYANQFENTLTNEQELYSQENSITVEIPDPASPNQFRTLKFLQLKPTKEQLYRRQKALDDNFFRYENDYSNGIQSFEKSGAKDLGMNGTPVLDQGRYSTCATFGVSGFLDAYIGKGDYIDQQCLLALSKSVSYNFWHGSEAKDIFPLFQNYGIVEKDHCFGSKYPDQYQTVYSYDYARISNLNLLSRVSLQEISISASSVKREIDAGNRVLLTVMLSGSSNTTDPISINGFNVIVDGEQKKGGGLWACSQPGSYTNYCGRMNAGHLLTIVGYDDKQKLFKIRNSWGGKFGDNGDYYMTYEFLQAMARNLHVLRNYNL